MKSFSIIIVTWNGLHHLKTFLPSVDKTEYPDYEIIIADNNSTDGTKEWLAETYPHIKIAAFDDNYGYTGGHNRAVPYAEKEILLFLNNDVEVTPNWLDGISRVFDLSDQVDIVQPKLRSYNEPEMFEYAGAAGGFLDRFGYPYCQGRILDTVEPDEGQYEEMREITWASGAAFAIKKDVFEHLQGFDESFEFHMEEIDLCWRAINSGSKVFYTPGSTVYHLGGGSLPMGSTRKVYYNFRNSLLMLWKNLPTHQLFYKIFIRLVLDGVAAFRSLISGKPGEFVAIAKAHFHFYTRLPGIHRKRKDLKKDGDAIALSPISIIWRYFILRKKTFRDIQP